MLPARFHRRSHAFTLLELLVVIALIAVLASFTFGVIRSSKQGANLARARAELSHLVQALEDYKRHYGDYPQTGPSAANSQRVTGTAGPGLNTAAARLFNALIGVYGPTNFNTRLNGPKLVDIGKLAVERPLATATFAVASGSPPTKTPENNAFLDPWGNRYLYFYKAVTPGGGAPPQWNAPSFVLYSAGPDGAATTLPNALGIFSGTTQTTGDNADNVYADKLP
ncbi:MAG: prepilin-type N-terminal cleavage/methylation domain-containing protein [Opitutaceae bacterium]